MRSRFPVPTSLETVVAVARSPQPGYAMLKEPAEAPELPSGCTTTVAHTALRDLFSIWGLDAERAGTRKWNPLGTLIPPGARVVLKPNWVLHYNHAGTGMECLVTHPSVIEAVLEYISLARPSEVVVGDAPVQGCDFPALMESCHMESLAARFRGRGFPLRIADFRRTILDGMGFGDARTENCHRLARYVLFDLAAESLLEPLACDARKFRVTMYDPGLLHRTHAPGKHQYLIAREVIEADIVVSLPKLKSHTKACITGALKNIVGINGNKEFLPHHRKGGLPTAAIVTPAVRGSSGARRISWMPPTCDRRAGGADCSASPRSWPPEAHAGLEPMTTLKDPGTAMIRSGGRV